MASDPNGGVCLIRRVVIRNYKSIAACDVELGPLTFLVGPNGSGKSNFLDALRFVSDSLRYSLEHALRDRGGFEEVRFRSAASAQSFGIRLEFQLPNGMHGHYAFEVKGNFDAIEITHEECFVTGGPMLPMRTAFFRVSDGRIFVSLDPLAVARSADRLYLVSLSGTHEFRPVFDALSTMGFYNLNPDTIRDLQPPYPGELLARDGANISGVVQRLAARSPRIAGRIAEYLGQVVPGITGVEAISLGPRETLAFSQRVSSATESLQFWAANMSDGTLRAVGVLVALFQGEPDGNNPPLLVGIEEPETTLHPAAADVLVDAMRDATSLRQVLVTSHSPELLDNVSIADSEILPVVAHNGATRIGRMDEAGRSVLEDELFSAGDLLRMNQLRPDPAAGSPNPDELKLFEEGAPA